VSPGRLRIAAALLLTSPFVPMLFQGEEWAASTPFRYFTDHQDPELGQAVSQGRRREFAHFGWDPADVPDPQDPATMASSVLAWDELADPPHAELLRWHRDLLRLRRARPELTDGRWTDQEIDHDAAAGWLRVQRGGVVVAAHLGAEPVEIPVPARATPAVVDGRALVSGAERRDDVVALEPDGVAVLVVD